jgi:hypothetical protein
MQRAPNFIKYGACSEKFKTKCNKFIYEFWWKGLLQRPTSPFPEVSYKIQHFPNRGFGVVSTKKFQISYHEFLGDKCGIFGALVALEATAFEVKMHLFEITEGSGTVPSKSPISV